MKAYYESRSYTSEIPLSASYSVDMDFVAHWHTDIEMIYVCEGAIGVGINSEYKQLKKGELAICGSNDIHYYDSEGKSSTIMIIIFRPEILSTFKYWPENLLPCSIFMDNGYFCIQKTGSDIQDNIKTIFDHIVDEMAHKENLYPLFADLRIFELFLTLFRHFPAYYSDSKRNLADSHTPADIKPMQKALKYLEENYPQDITLEQISEEVNLSRFYFSRLFRKTTGMNFNFYLTRIRIDKAELMIKSTRKPIIDIAYETGFCSIRTFNRSFKGLKGCTPQSLRHSL